MKDAAVHTIRTSIPPYIDLSPRWGGGRDGLGDGNQHKSAEKKSKHRLYMVRPRIYVQEINDAYVFVGTHIIHFSEGVRDEIVRLTADRNLHGAYYGGDGYRYQIGETVILMTHPLTGDRVFFDADHVHDVPESFAERVNGTMRILIPRGASRDMGDYVTNIILSIDDVPRLTIESSGGDVW
jgi:hypothetical protein